MNLREIEIIQKQNAANELEGWLAILRTEVCLGSAPTTVEKVKQALFALSQTTKALRRHGHFLGLDKEDNG